MVTDRLRDFIREALMVEYGDEFGDFDGGGWSDLVKVAGSPQNVVKTALGHAANVSSKLKTVVSVFAKGIPSLVLPYVSTHYDRIYAREDRRWDDIRRRYPDVFNAAKRAFPKDAQLVAFMVDPVTMTLSLAANAVSGVAADLIGALSAGDPTLRHRVRSMQHDVTHEARLFEERGPDLSKLLHDKDFVKRLTTTRVVQDIKRRAHGIKNDSLNEVITLARRAAAVQSMDDMEQLLGRQPQLKQLASLPDEEQAQGQEMVLDELKRAIVTSIIARVQAELKEFRELGVPDEAEVLRAYNNAIDKIQSLMPGSP